MRWQRLNLRKVLMNFVIVCVFLVFIPSISYADLRGKVIWMDEAEMASEVVPKLEKFSKMEEEIKVIKEEVTNCEKKNEEFKQQLVYCSDAKDDIVQVMDQQKEAYEKIIEESETGIFEKIGIAGGGAGIGVLIGLIIGIVIL